MLLRQEVLLNVSHTASAAQSLAVLRRSQRLKNAVGCARQSSERSFCSATHCSSCVRTSAASASLPAPAAYAAPARLTGRPRCSRRASPRLRQLAAPLHAPPDWFSPNALLATGARRRQAPCTALTSCSQLRPHQRRRPTRSRHSFSASAPRRPLPAHSRRSAPRGNLQSAQALPSRQPGCRRWRARRPARAPASAAPSFSGHSRRVAGEARHAAACRVPRRRTAASLAAGARRAGRPARAPASAPARHDGHFRRAAGAARASERCHAVQHSG